MNEFRAKLDKVNKVKGNVKIKDVIKGKLTNENTPSVSWNPYEINYKITRENILRQADMYTGNNPLFSDEEYAKKTKYGRPVTFSLLLTLEAMPVMSRRDGIWDYIVERNL